MNRNNKFLIVILAVLTTGVLLTGAMVFSTAARQQEDVDPAEPAGESRIASAADQPTPVFSAVHATDASIAYVNEQPDEDGFSAIYVMDADDLNPQRLVESENGYCLFPSWSPDGQKIAYLRYTPGADEEFWNGNDLTEVWVATLDGSAHVRISDAIPSIDEARTVAWSPDGTRFAFLGQAVEETTDTLFVFHTDSSELEHSIPLDFWAIEMMLWSPTGDELLFIPETDTPRMTVHILSLEDQQISSIYGVGMMDSWGWGSPLDWSPDGTEFAVVDTLAKKVLIMDTDGEVRQDAWIPDRYPVEVAWSPNGAYIAVTVSMKALDAGDTSDMEIHILDAETGESVAVFHEQGGMVAMLDWSSDSNRLLFTSLFETPGGWAAADGMWIYDVTSGALEQLDTGGGDDQIVEMGVWSP